MLVVPPILDDAKLTVLGPLGSRVRVYCGACDNQDFDPPSLPADLPKYDLELVPHRLLCSYWPLCRLLHRHLGFNTLRMQSNRLVMDTLGGEQSQQALHQRAACYLCDCRHQHCPRHVCFLPANTKIGQVQHLVREEGRRLPNIPCWALRDHLQCRPTPVPGSVGKQQQSVMGLRGHRHLERARKQPRSVLRLYAYDGRAAQAAREKGRLGQK